MVAALASSIVSKILVSSKLPDFHEVRYYERYIHIVFEGVIDWILEKMLSSIYNHLVQDASKQY